VLPGKYQISFRREFFKPASDNFSQPKQRQIEVLIRNQVFLDQLESLGRIKELGLLTDEEFMEQKKKLLERL
jgi:hypothetical protein